MWELSWLSLLGGLLLAAACAAALLLGCSPRTRRDVRLAFARNAALRSKLYNQLGLSMANGSLPAFGKAYEVLDSAFSFPFINAAFELGIIDLLQNAPHSAKAVVEEVKADNAYAVSQLLQFLHLNGMIFAKDGEGGEKLYWHNMPKSAIEEARTTVQMQQLCNYRQFYHLTESVREDDAVGLRTFFPGANSLYHARELYPEVNKLWTPWMETTTELQMGAAIESLDLSSCSDMLDWCGSLGYNSIKLLKKFPNLSSTVLDLPKVCELVPETVRAAGVDAKRVQTISLDLSDSFELPGAYDCVVMCNCVIEWKEKDLLRFFSAIKKALRPGGKVIILSVMGGPQNEPHQVAHMTRFNAYFFCCADSGCKVHDVESLERLLGIAGFTSMSHRLQKAYGTASATILEAS